MDKNFSKQFIKPKLTTAEATKLIDLLKNRVTEATLLFPSIGKKLEFDVYATKNNSKFIINISRGSIDKKKCTYQGRTYLNNIPLLRLDITNSIHINPDGKKIIGNHLHIYNEKHDMQYAIKFDIKRNDLYEYCLEFFKEFNILEDTCNILYQTEM